ncbi:hypothetical protein GCM10023336_02080 [Streptomyces similanensis]|uniref:Transposase IS110-like N-terminal domain-containing protein n=1 Tax=Streptomyces similanensis TaxID=1274988 RepID=A0ABP9JR56_9ACTN
MQNLAWSCKEGGQRVRRDASRPPPPPLGYYGVIIDGDHETGTELKLRALCARFQAKHRTVSVVVDQPALISTLPLVVTRDTGCPVAYLPGLTVRRIAEYEPRPSAAVT